MLHSDTSELGSTCVEVNAVEPDVLAAIGEGAEVDELLQSVLRVRVIEPGKPEDEDLPDVSGRLRFCKVEFDSFHIFHLNLVSTIVRASTPGRSVALSSQKWRLLSSLSRER
jgi:hypothetical protein